MYVRMLTSLAGENFAFMARDIVKTTSKQAKAWIERGMAEEYDHEKVLREAKTFGLAPKRTKKPAKE